MQWEENWLKPKSARIPVPNVLPRTDSSLVFRTFSSGSCSFAVAFISCVTFFSAPWLLPSPSQSQPLAKSLNNPFPVNSELLLLCILIDQYFFFIWTLLIFHLNVWFLPISSGPCSSTSPFYPTISSLIFLAFLSLWFLSFQAINLHNALSSWMSYWWYILSNSYAVYLSKSSLERIINMHCFHILSYLLVSPLPPCPCPYCSTKSALLEVISDMLIIKIQSFMSAHRVDLFVVLISQTISGLG